MADFTLKSNSLESDILSKFTTSISYAEYKRLMALGESLIEINSPFFKGLHDSALQKGEITNIEIWSRAYNVTQAYIVNMLADQGFKTITFVEEGTELKKRATYLNALRASFGENVRSSTDATELPEELVESFFGKTLIVGFRVENPKDLAGVRLYTQREQDKNGEMFIPVIDRAFERFAALSTRLVGEFKNELSQIPAPVLLFNFLKMPSWVPNNRSNLPAAVTMAKNFRDNVLVRPTCKIAEKELVEVGKHFENNRPVELECFYGRGDYLSEKDALKTKAIASRRKGFLPVTPQ